MGEHAGRHPERAAGSDDRTAYAGGVERIELNSQQRATVRRMMEAIVQRDERTVAGLLRREYSEIVYAAPASDFWMWADDYAGERLRLVVPPGDVDDWGVWGFPLRDRPDVLALHVDV